MRIAFFREELAWAAGFFDGEGNCSWLCANDRRVRTYPYLQLTQVEMSVLKRFHEAVGGLGKFYGPYHYKQANGRDRKPYWRWQTTSYEHGQAVVALLWPFLSGPKKTQIITNWRKP